MDLMLDLIVRPEEGLRVAARAERDEPPFCEGWHDWRPSAEWTLPELPASWGQTCR